MVNSGGDWWLANLEMERALKFAGYDYQFRSSDGHHMDKYAETFPEAMTWLWRDWPAQSPSEVAPPRMQDFLLASEPWKIVGEGYQRVCGLAVNPHGEVFFCDPSANRIYRVGATAKWRLSAGQRPALRALTYGRRWPSLRRVGSDRRSARFRSRRPVPSLASGIHGHDLVAFAAADCMYTSLGPEGTAESKVWYVSPTGAKKVVDTGLQGATGVAVSCGWLALVCRGRPVPLGLQLPDQRRRYTVNKQRFYWLHVPDDANDSGAEGLCVDREGRLFTATRMGIQVSGLQGHIQGIISAPYQRVSAMCFGGPNFDMLYAACGDKVFQRKVRSKGPAPSTSQSSRRRRNCKRLPYEWQIRSLFIVNPSCAAGSVALLFFVCQPSLLPLRGADQPAVRDLAPRGTITAHEFDQSKIFPGTTRKYWVYVPQQYNPAKPACVYVGQDGLNPKFTDAFDRLISSHQMPVTVGIFIAPGSLPAPTANAAPRVNRSFEYNSLGDDYARFLLEELLPTIVREQKLNLSTDGNDRAIGGCSSGASAAFTAAWERPDAFRRVFGVSGAYPFAAAVAIPCWSARPRPNRCASSCMPEKTT